MAVEVEARLGSRRHDPETVMSLTFEVELPADLDRFRLPAAVAARLQSLLDIQDTDRTLTQQERDEAQGLVDLAELLTLLRLRAERANHGAA